MHFVYTYTSSYFPFYNDECRRVHYDNDDAHVLHDTQRSTDLQMLLRTTSSTLVRVGPKGCEPPEDPRSYVLVMCRKILHI